MFHRLPPGKDIGDWWTILRSGLWRVSFSLSREGKARLYSESLPLLHHTKQRVLGERDDKSYYLDYIGTKPFARGKGYARKLIEHGLAMVEYSLSPQVDSHCLTLTSNRRMPTAHQRTWKAPQRLMCRTTRNLASSTSKKFTCRGMRNQSR